MQRNMSTPGLKCSSFSYFLSVLSSLQNHSHPGSHHLCEGSQSEQLLGGSDGQHHLCQRWKGKKKEEEKTKQIDSLLIQEIEFPVIKLSVSVDGNNVPKRQRSSFR